jgi:ABC-type lipoprotein release transport system permease subunit
VISATDLRVMLGVPAALAAVAAIACLAPARRASRLDPAAILRES